MKLDPKFSVYFVYKRYFSDTSFKWTSEQWSVKFKITFQHAELKFRFIHYSYIF